MFVIITIIRMHPACPVEEVIIDFDVHMSLSPCERIALLVEPSAEHTIRMVLPFRTVCIERDNGYLALSKGFSISNDEPEYDEES